jgi:hypothetical protein
MEWGIITTKARNERPKKTRKKTKTDVDGRRVAAAEHFTPLGRMVFIHTQPDELKIN